MEQLRAQVDLLGLVGYACLAAFEQTATASAGATRVGDKLVLARIAAQRFSHLGRLNAEVEARGGQLEPAMQPYVAAIDSFNKHTAPATWGEALVKLCVVGGLAQDLYDRVGATVGPELAKIWQGSMDDGELADEPGRMLADLLADDPDQHGRLALFGRRLLGELLSQAQRVAAGHPDLSQLLTGQDDGTGSDIAALSELMARLADDHAMRMERLGLA